MDYMEYAVTIWQYLPYIFYTFVFLTLVPKSLKKINDFARADYEANRNKYHRCYAPDICCHTLDEERLPKQKPRKAVTRVYPKKQTAKKDQQQTAAPPIALEEPSNIYKRQVHTHTNVNKIAKMFESGGVQKKINRVTPTILPDFRRASLDMDDIDIFERKELFGTSKQEGNANKRDNVILRRLSKLSHELEENNEKSANVLNQLPSGENNEFNSSWRSEPIDIQRRNRHIPTPLTLNSGNSATPSTMSPAHSSPLCSPVSSNSPVLPASPTLQIAPLLNMKSSLEDIFAAIAKSAENTDSLLYRGCTSLSPVTSIDDILSQRRLSRPLSAYSISDLLNDENNSSNSMDETYMENFLKVLNKT